MRKIFLLVFLVLAGPMTIAQKDAKSAKLTIDPNIVKSVKFYCEPMDFKHVDENIPSFDSIYQLSKAAVLIRAYENGELAMCNEDLTEKTLIRSYYLWKGDTFLLFTGLGLDEGFGFNFSLANEETDFEHVGEADFPSFSTEEKSKLLKSIAVPCERFSVVLSKIPEPGDPEPIYGYATFKSIEFFQTVGITAMGKDALPRTRVQNEMTIYFIASYSHAISKMLKKSSKF